MKFTWRGEAFNLAVLVAMLVLAAYAWETLPEPIPVHWNADAQVDRYGGKAEVLLVVPLFTLAIYGLMFVLPRIDPGRANYALFGGAYAVLRSSIIAFFGAVYALVVFSAAGAPVDAPGVIGVLVGALFVVIGNLLGKIRPNWFVGIRTPWTLSSKRSWARTHRLGGWLFIAIGIVFGAAVVSRSAPAIVLAIAFVVLAIVWLVAYSYVVWRDDPEKTPPAATLPADEQ